MKNNNKNNGVAVILVLILAVVVLVAFGLVYYQNNMSGKQESLTVQEMADKAYMEETSTPPSSQPVSKDTSLETIEMELGATITGSPDSELQTITEESNSL